MTLRVLLCVFAAVVASTAADSNIKMGENTWTAEDTLHNSQLFACLHE